MAPGFDVTVKSVLDNTSTDPSDIFLEVTETAFLEDGPRALSVLTKIKEVGVGLILDDFGTGYSSLNYLREFPFDILRSTKPSSATSTARTTPARSWPP